MNWARTIGRLWGARDVQSIESARLSFGSSWAQNGPWLLLMGCLVLGWFSFWFYRRGQSRCSLSWRRLLAAIRASTLSLALLILADPILELTLVTLPRPVLWILLDGSDSMSIPDEYPSSEQNNLARAVDLKGFQTNWPTDHSSQNPAKGRPNPSRDDSLSRADYVRALFLKHDRNLIQQWGESYRLRLFSFGDTAGVRLLADDNSIDPQALVQEWKTTGSVTPLGDAFEELTRQHPTDNLAAVLVFSDFDQNSGTPPLTAARRLAVPVFTVGVGPVTAVDLSVDFLVPPTMKKAESSTISVTVRQRELANVSVTVKLTAQQLGNLETLNPEPFVIGERNLTMTDGSAQAEFAFTPEVTGRYLITAEVDTVPGEVVTENNQATREVAIIDDFLRLMFVEYEPTWEWRFIKEVFHRDKLVGTRGFRTFLRSADPVVRETNELFLSTLTLPRSQFFENDVIFLGDMPASALSSRFCEMTKEFVSQFGGGLVVIAGPRFGPGQLAETALADMLPVVVDPDFKRQDRQEFRLNLTPVAAQFDFMRLGNTDADNLKGWNNLGKLSWYQPVRRIDARGTYVLAEHPTDKCIDDKTAQPLIAVRQYGRGEVVYVAFNEMWRLRRFYGESFYRQFWGQLIHRLGLSHALGSHKRFIVRTDKKQYRSEEQVRITVEAFDKEFNPLDEKDIPGGRLAAEIIRSDRNADGNPSQTVAISQLKPGVFEAVIPVYGRGEYSVRVTDPVSQEVSERNFSVADVSIERRNPVRNALLQQNLAAETGGKAYDLLDVEQFAQDFHPQAKMETSIEMIPLWSTWPMFLLILTLLLVEWTVRKFVNLA